MSQEKDLIRDSQWLRRVLEDQQKSEGLVALLPKGAGSGLDADMVDGLHAIDIIEQCIEEIKKIDLLLRTTSGAGTAVSSNALSIKGKTVDDSAIGDGKVLTYVAASDTIVYSSAGAGDMTKATYDVTATGSKVDTALNSEKLNGHTEAQVQTHAPANHGNEVHTSTFVTQGAIDTHAGLTTGIHGVAASTIDNVADRNTAIGVHAALVDVHHARAHDHSNALDGSPIALAGIPATLTGKDADTLDTLHAASFETLAHKDAASGYAGLSASSKVAAAEMPSGTIVTTITFHIAGTLTTGQKVMRLLAPCALTLTKVRLVVDTAPTGANLIVDVHTGTGAGTTIFTTQGNRPTIVATAKTGVSVAPDVTAIAEAVEFSVFIDQIGSTVAGADLSIEVVGTQAVTFT